MTSDEGPLGDTYRPIRVVRARVDGPWPGVLAHTSTGDAFVLVDADALGAQWRGWDAAADGHVLAPVDVARRSDGHDVVLPVCVERLEEFVRRRATRMPLSAGEAVTLGVSVLRACLQIAPAPDTTGDWWLDDAGRPLLATDASPHRALDTAAAVLEQVAVDPRAERTWATALRAVTAERISVRELEAAEEALFAVATPEPLSTVSLNPRSAAAEGAPRADASAYGGGAREGGEAAPTSLWQSLLAGVDNDLADSVSRATTAVWRRLRRIEPTKRNSSRRAPWLVGGAVAAAVLAGGALWPTASGVATEDHADVVTTPAPTATGAGADPSPTSAAPQGAPAADVSAGTALTQVAGGLLDARTACGGATDCLATVVADATTLPEGAIDLPAGERALTLLDDFGDIAVLRLDAADGALPSQMVVILKRDEKWLLRDVSDVAQQPEQ
ncbi:hypothetical protein [Microbacterium sp. B35-30]|uniref:hypothetical protein n=1 Tax=Microbacterium sp. B35-30 TaxID=1962642 RepID=UPI0013D6E8E8|nr:hypothetical protein [Microbacterium sp. B35-30]KAF2419197.1 hypothetical protein B2K11_05195 [Microbacterium sp. B35-30]